MSFIEQTSLNLTIGQEIVICHHGHENDICCTENISEFLSARGAMFKELNLGRPGAAEELKRCLQQGPSTALIGFNSQLDHTWVGDEPLLMLAASCGVAIVQWIFDHPSIRWPEFNYSNQTTSRFLFHSQYSLSYFGRYCCPGATAATVGSIGPNWRSRSSVSTPEDFLARPINCIVALGLARLGRTAAQTDEAIDALDEPLRHCVTGAIAASRFDLDQALEVHLVTALKKRGIYPDNDVFNRCFHLLQDSVQSLRRAEILRTASQFDVLIQSDDSARTLIESGRASMRYNVSTHHTLDAMPRCRAALSVSPVNDSIHDRACNALNGGCIPILEDNRAHRELFTHGQNALLFRYDDNSLAECLALACGSPGPIYPLAERAHAMRDQSPFRFGAFPNIISVAAAKWEGGDVV